MINDYGGAGMTTEEHINTIYNILIPLIIGAMLLPEDNPDYKTLRSAGETCAQMLPREYLEQIVAIIDEKKGQS
jgi:hypothetical protein